MIYPASTLILASLVFNAAAVLGAPLRLSSDVNDVAARKVHVIDVPAQVRSVAETREFEDDMALSSRTSPAEDDQLYRRSPRRFYSDFHARRSSSNEARSAGSSEEELERRFPRRELYERHGHDKRSESDVEARSESESLQRRYPRAVYHNYYEKRSTPEQHEARSDDQLVRRFPRRVYAEAFEKRQVQAVPAVAPAVTDTAAALLAAQPTAVAGGAVIPPVQVTDPALAPPNQVLDPALAPPSQVLDPALAPPTQILDPALAPPAQITPQVTDLAALNAVNTAAVTNNLVLPPATPTFDAFSTSVTQTLAAGVPVVAAGHSGIPQDINAIVQNLTAHAGEGHGHGTTIQETTLLINKITHVNEHEEQVDHDLWATTIQHIPVYTPAVQHIPPPVHTPVVHIPPPVHTPVVHIPPPVQQLQVHTPVAHQVIYPTPTVVHQVINGHTVLAATLVTPPAVPQATQFVDPAQTITQITPQTFGSNVVNPQINQVVDNIFNTATAAVATPVATPALAAAAVPAAAPVVAAPVVAKRSPGFSGAAWASYLRRDVN